MKTVAVCRVVLGPGVAAMLLVGCAAPRSPAPVPQVPIAPDSTTAHNVGTESSSYRVLHSFGEQPDGANPEASLIGVSGMLYGTTRSGGAYKKGTVFTIDTAGSERVLHSFGSGSDGIYPTASLLDVNGTLYGTTYWGGTGYGLGTVFSISTTGTERVLHSFAGPPDDGMDAAASLIDVDGMLYGTTITGGTYGDGTVFTITTTGTEQVVYSFTNASGGHTPASLIDVKGNLYGTTPSGGKYDSPSGGDGTVFRVTTSGTEEVLHSFGRGHDGTFPTANLIDVNGTLYGTTPYGGKNGLLNGGDGTVFSITTAGAEHVLFNFDGRTDGHNPVASLINVEGTLYGTTNSGGTFGRGTVFSVSTHGIEHVLHSFGRPPDGSRPDASLIDVDSTLYGTTYSGGAHGRGTVFALTP
jgi:uncharacterized repeat protein (TIGR03803 family)